METSFNDDRCLDLLSPYLEADSGPIVGLLGSTCEKTATCFLRCSINFGHVFPPIILLPTSCINPTSATIRNITVLFLFFPMRGLSIFTRPNELLNAEELYPNLFAVKK